MQTLLNDLKELLKKDDRLVSNNELLKNKIVELGLKLDASLIKLLLSNKKIKEHFFVEVDKSLVFDKDKFMKFIDNKDFLPDSYTTFRNKIGLTSDKQYLSKSNEVVLSWPYKDCILEGGMKKEDEKRKEIFHNEILAPDEIDRLLESKVLTNFKRIDAKGEYKVTGIKPTDNLIIKGNNLLAISSLKKKFRGKIGLIYIDPPFNRDADVFYNDSFKHSSWLTFMKNRIEIAKDLLMEEGSIFVHLDDTESAYAKVLLDEVFGKENYCNTIIFATNAPFGFKGTARDLFKQANHILFYSKDKSKSNLKKVFIEKTYDRAYKYIFDDISKPEKEWEWKLLDKIVAKEFGFEDKKSAIEKIGKNDFESKVALFAIDNADRVFRTASVTGGAFIKRKETIKISKENKDKIIRHPDDDMDYMFISGERVLFYKDRLKEIDGDILPAQIITDIWADISIEGISKEGGVNFAKSKKPEELLKRIIEMTTEKGDIVLDYHLGSGTTCAVAHKMKRRYIGIEQLDYEENGSVTRLKNVTQGDKSGISRLVDWKGGGDFVYCELRELNEAFIKNIKKSKNSEELLKLWDEAKSNGFLSHRIDEKLFDSNIDEFKKLGLEDQKRLIIECLDKNDLYVNYSEIEDRQYGVSKEDIELNKKFYEVL